MLGHEIERARRARHWSQSLLSHEAGVSLSTVQRAENSDPSVSFKKVNQLAAALDVPVSSFYLDAPIATAAGRQTSLQLALQQQHEQVMAALETLRKQNEVILRELRQSR